MNIKMPWALRRSWRVLLAYGAFTAWGLICLVASVFLILGEKAVPAITESLVMTIAGISGATVVGHIIGNGVALLRLRMWVVMVFAGVIALSIGIASAALGPLTGFFVVGALAAAGGYFGVASRMDIIAAWLPLSYAMGAAIIWMNNHQKVSVWLTGAKFAVWDAVTFVFLSGAVLLFLVYLTSRNALALTLWQASARPGGEVGRASWDVDARAGRGSVGVIFFLTGLVLVATAMVSPFLFRTRAVEGAQAMMQQQTQWHGNSKFDVTTTKGKPKQLVYDGAGYGYGGEGTGSGGYGSGTGGYGNGSGGAGYGTGGTNWKKATTYGKGYGYGGKGTGKGGKGVGNGGKGKGKGGKGYGTGGTGGTGGQALAYNTPPPSTPTYTPPPVDPTPIEPPPPPKEEEKPVAPPEPPKSCVPGDPNFDPTCLTTLKTAPPPGGDPSATVATTGTNGAGGGGGDVNGRPPQLNPDDVTAYANIDPNFAQPDMHRAAEKTLDVAKIGAFMLAVLIGFLVLVLLALAVFYRPLRRAIVLRHLERPLWTTPPTRRVENLWLRALVALDDVGIAVRHDETPQKLAARIAQELALKNGGEAPVGMDAAAQIMERIEYAGRGLSGDEETKMRAAVLAFLAYVNKHLTPAKKFALGWSPVRSR